MFISYSINANNGVVALQFSKSKDHHLLNPFSKNEGVPSSEMIRVDTDKEEYLKEDAYSDLAKHLWGQLGDIPTDEDGVDGSIDEDFLHFSKGTPVYDIWHWFESEFDLSIAKDLMGI